MDSTSDDAWAQALAEVESGARQPGLWARCFAQAEGDENKAKAAYIAERVKASAGAPSPVEAKPEPTPDGVCPSCGRACWLDALTCPACEADFGPGSAWKPRARQLGEVLTPPKSAAAQLQPGPSSDMPPKKSGSNWLAWVIGVPVGVFVLMLVIGASMSPEKTAQYDKAARIEAACDKMMADSALGDERRMTRTICDNMKQSEGR